ncbi:MAG: thiamine phosphate synthase [Lentisphaerae bacterium]|nr:thiamine phosphate synthase [Lentisphaerota bacterium]MCP4100999.1 thiamine phosphate synthase [Lentisphaerota bacterium]
MPSPFENKTARIAAFKNIDIYPVISSEFTAGRDVIDVLKSIAVGGAKIVQIREKNKSKIEVYKLALEYRRITAEHNMLLIINDHVDIALAVDADGVHLGQDDLPVSAARPIAPELILGCSSHDIQEATEAEASGADYVNVGPIYPTGTKAVPCGVVGIEMLEAIKPHISIPFTVMGGIKEHHLSELFAVGATKIAMVTEITQAEDVTAKVNALRSHWSDR